MGINGSINGITEVWVAASGGGGGGTGTVTSVSAGGGLNASVNPITTTGDIFIANTGVSAGRYTLPTIDINARGQITSAANGAAGSGTVTSAGFAGTQGVSIAGSPITTQGVVTIGLGDITPTNISTSAGTFSGKLTGVAARFAGIVSADAGINATTISAASIGLTGDLTADRITASAATISNRLTASTALFSGIVSADAGIRTTTVSGNSIGVTGDINASTGRITASAMTVNSLFSGNTASFAGMVSANAGLRATTVSASGVIGASNLSGNNTGDQTITLTGDVSGSGTGSFGTVVTRLQTIQVKAGTPGDGQVLSYNASAGNWEPAAVAGSGTVTSVSAGAGLLASPNPITGAGAIQLDTSAENAWTAQQYFAVATLTDASAISWNLKSQQVAQVTINGTGTRQFQEPTNMRNGATYILRAVHGSANSCTLAWTSAYRWPNSTAPTFSTASGAVDIFTFVCMASAMWGSYTQNYMPG